ncbi:MAG: transcription termination/antitermination factor NusG [Opitutales bacterium]|nr:transcription termination/antitermination factor NusG [Opitutales bacterium]
MASETDLRKWYVVQVRSNMENKAVESLKTLIKTEDMGGILSEDDILMPVETVSEVKNGKTVTRQRKLYPGYIFVKMKLYDEDENFLDAGWYFVKKANGVINFMGGNNPTPLRDSEVLEMLAQIETAKGTVRPKVNFSVGEHIKITDGSFLNMTGVVEGVDAERGKLKVSVSIFGRFTPVELDFDQASKIEE